MVPGVSGLRIDVDAMEGVNLEPVEWRLRTSIPALLGLGGTGAETIGGLGGALSWKSYPCAGGGRGGAGGGTYGSPLLDGW